MTLGEELKTARLEKNLSVEQLSTLSRVSVKNIQSFEADDFSTDAKVFVMANLSAIAKVLEIDISPKFESAPSVNPSPNVIDVLDREGEPLQRRNYTFVVMTIGLLLLFALILVGLFSRTPSSTPLPDVSISPTSSQSENPPNEFTGVTVVLAAESRSWVSVKNSVNQIIFERILETGESLSFNDTTSLTVTIGNAAGINLTVNDENIGYLGGIGQVVSQTFTSPVTD